MTILVTDWGNFSQVLPIAMKYRVGLEFQEFVNPQNLDHPDDLVKTIGEGLINLPLASMHGPFAELVPASWDPLVRQVAAKRFQQAHNIAHKTSAKHLILHSGFIPKTYPLEKWIQNTYDFWMEFLRDRPEPGLIHLENVYENDFHGLRELVDRVNNSYNTEVLTICLDIGHINANSSRSFEEWISGLGDRIRYVHLHNNDGILDDHWRLDRGKIDISRVLDLLMKHSPHAAWSVETIEGDTEPSLLWLQSRGFL